MMNLSKNKKGVNSTVIYALIAVLILFFLLAIILYRNGVFASLKEGIASMFTSIGGVHEA